MQNTGPAFFAGATIAPSVIVKVSTAADMTVLLCGLNEVAFGVSQDGQLGSPGVAGSDTTIAATVGLPIGVTSGANVALLTAGAAVTRGSKLESDASGYGVTMLTTAATIRNVIGWALQSASGAGVLIDVWVWPHAVTNPA